MIEAEIDITEAMESFSKAAKSHDYLLQYVKTQMKLRRLLTMNVNLRNISNIELAKLFDLAAKADDRHLAKKLFIDQHTDTMKASKHSSDIQANGR